ncbi:MAG TPA: hypothetical protein V6C91_17255 [Coleofasciculaceae cyanobacterium]
MPPTLFVRDKEGQMCKLCSITLLATKSRQRQLQQDTQPETLSSWGRLTPNRDLLSSASDRTLNPTDSQTPNLSPRSGN